MHPNPDQFKRAYIGGPSKKESWEKRKKEQDYAKPSKYIEPHSPHLPPKGSEPKEKDWQIKKKNNRTAINPKDKDYIKRHRDDDDKNPPMGGSKVPRKPKPGPKSPGTYRPIERKVDPDYAKKHDRYRVMAM